MLETIKGTELFKDTEIGGAATKVLLNDGERLEAQRAKTAYDVVDIVKTFDGEITPERIEAYLRLSGITRLS